MAEENFPRTAVDYEQKVDCSAKKEAESAARSFVLAKLREPIIYFAGRYPQSMGEMIGND